MTTVNKVIFDELNYSPNQIHHESNKQTFVDFEEKKIDFKSSVTSSNAIIILLSIVIFIQQVKKNKM